MSNMPVMAKQEVSALTELDDLNKSAEEIIELFSRLENRLSPVLPQGSKQPIGRDSEPNPNMQDSPTLSRIRSLREKVSFIRGRIRFIIDEVQA